MLGVRPDTGRGAEPAGQIRSVSGMALQEPRSLRRNEFRWVDDHGGELARQLTFERRIPVSLRAWYRHRRGQTVSHAEGPRTGGDIVQGS